MRVSALHHITLLVSNTETALAFYCHVLGLARNTRRPDLGFPGAWLEIGEQQIHLIESDKCSRPVDPALSPSRDRHLAFSVDSLDDFKQALNGADISYTESQRRKALFCRDPDGNGLEFIERD